MGYVILFQKPAGLLSTNIPDRFAGLSPVWFLVCPMSIPRPLARPFTDLLISNPDLCYGIVALVYDLVFGCVAWLLTSEFPCFSSRPRTRRAHSLSVDIAKPIVLMLAGLAFGLFIGLAIVVQSPIKAAQDWWAVKQSRREMEKWNQMGSSHDCRAFEYQQLASLSSIHSS